MKNDQFQDVNRLLIHPILQFVLTSSFNFVLKWVFFLGKYQNMEDSGAQSDLRVVVYESLEQKRANKIGVKPLQNFDVTR